jgi:hypothetical protein
MRFDGRDLESAMQIAVIGRHEFHVALPFQQPPWQSDLVQNDVDEALSNQRAATAGTAESTSAEALNAANN